MWRRFIGDESGQVILEYVLTLSTMLVITGVLVKGLKKAILLVWGRIAKDVAAPCPGCTPPQEVRF